MTASTRWPTPIELSYDKDYIRFRTSFFFASGDGNPNNHHATGFDTILDNPNFAGTEFSYFMRQNIPLFGVNLKQRLSIVPDLRSSKIQGQSNFVNPGLELYNIGFDVDVTPKPAVVRQDGSAGDLCLSGEHRPIHRRRPEHRNGISPFVE
jgi:hypothetical protein